MNPDFGSGNASADGSPFRQWLVGDLSSWRAGGGNADSTPAGPRDTRAVAVKWAAHRAGEDRPSGWAPPDDTVTLSILVSGRFTILFRNSTAAPPAVHLRDAGDYAIWRGSIEHSWRAELDSVVISVRWRESRAP